MPQMQTVEKIIEIPHIPQASGSSVLSSFSSAINTTQVPHSTLLENFRVVVWYIHPAPVQMVKQTIKSPSLPTAENIVEIPKSRQAGCWKDSRDATVTNRDRDRRDFSNPSDFESSFACCGVRALHTGGSCSRRRAPSARRLCRGLNRWHPCAVTRAGQRAQWCGRRSTRYLIKFMRTVVRDTQMCKVFWQ